MTAAPVALLSCRRCGLTFAHDTATAASTTCAECPPIIPKPRAATHDRDVIDPSSPAYRLVARLAHLEAAAVLAVTAMDTHRWSEAREALVAAIGDPERHVNNRRPEQRTAL